MGPRTLSARPDRWSDATMTNDRAIDTEVAAKASGHPVPALLVGTGEVRVLTERDLLRAIRSGTPPETPIARFAHPVAGLDTVSANLSLFEATELMLHAEAGQLSETAGPDSEDTLSIRDPSKQ